jgi:threonine synthase
MDIMVSSNFERLLFDLFDRNGRQLADFMQRCNTEATSLPASAFARARELFDSYAVDDDLTCQTIAKVFEESEYLLDPHSAIGVKAAREVRRSKANPMVVLATAHPAKFAEAALKSGQAEEPRLPHYMSDLMQREERCAVLPNDLAKVHAFMQKHISA